MSIIDSRAQKFPEVDNIPVKIIGPATAGAAIGNISELRAGTLAVSTTAAVNTSVTATLPAVAGQYHYITSIVIYKYYAATGVASATPIVVTSTNLPGSLAWSTEQSAAPQGTLAEVIRVFPSTPIRSSVVNTATTIVCPAQLETIWRVNVTYFTAA